MSLICKFFNHKWSAWLYEKDITCIQSRVCRRCKLKETRVLHEYVWLETTETSKKKKCKRCSHTEKMRSEICSQCGGLGYHGICHTCKGRGIISSGGTLAANACESCGGDGKNHCSYCIDGKLWVLKE